MSEKALILGIESSCDETACAVVADGREVLSNVVASQIELHARFGGVVPEIASRAHIEAINTVIAKALAESDVRPADISAVAVTNEPGLIGSLLVGLMAAKTLAWVWDSPLIGVNHVYAHAYAPALEAEPIEYPAAALVCSGGHTALYRCASPTELELLGTTIDDAAGEAFDKVAGILKLGYPGGPVIDKVAREGDPAAVEFPRPLLHGASLDFSFSGIKTAVLYHVNGVPGALRERSKPRSNLKSQISNPKSQISNLKYQISNIKYQTSNIERRTPKAAEVADIAASFQAAVVDVLRIKLRRAARKTGARTLIVGGGVAANSALRRAAAELAARLRCTLRLPETRFCVDNAAMTAGLAYHYLRAGRTATFDLESRATLKR